MVMKWISILKTTLPLIIIIVTTTAVITIVIVGIITTMIIIRLEYLIGANMERTGLKLQIQAFRTGEPAVLTHHAILTGVLVLRLSHLYYNTSQAPDMYYQKTLDPIFEFMIEVVILAGCDSTQQGT